MGTLYLLSLVGKKPRSSEQAVGLGSCWTAWTRKACVSKKFASETIYHHFVHPRWRAAALSKGNFEAILFRPKAVFSSNRPLLDVPNKWGARETSGRKCYPDHEAEWVSVWVAYAWPMAHAQLAYRRQGLSTYHRYVQDDAGRCESMF